MTIHSEHPFAAPPSERSAVRRFRGRTVAPVSVWAAGTGVGRVGWTVSSFVVADGEPAEVLGLLDEESDLADQLRAASGPDDAPTVTVNLLSWSDRNLADAFAGQAPAPGGVFRLGSWSDSSWGPVLDDAPAWLGARLRPEPLSHAGWALLVRAEIEHVELGPLPADGLLVHSRGRYAAVAEDRSTSLGT